jgi:TonB family protein
MAALVVMGALSLGVSAQGPVVVDESVIEQHVDHRVEPVFPPIAKAARVVGTVVFAVQIDSSGKLVETKVTGGPAMLQQAALDALKQWTFRPIERDGHAVSVAGQISIAFTLGKDDPTPDEEQTAQKYFPLFNECQKAVSARSDPQQTASVCDHAAKVAEQFAPDRRFIEKRSAFVWAGYAFLASDDAKSALAWGQKAVATAQLGHDDNSGNNAAYSVRAYAEARSGDLGAADRDLVVAEDFQRKGIAWAEKESPGLAKSYRQALIQNLGIHARLLQAMGRADEAQRALDEAAKLQQ